MGKCRNCKSTWKPRVKKPKYCPYCHVKNPLGKLTKKVPKWKKIVKWRGR